MKRSTVIMWCLAMGFVLMSGLAQAVSYPESWNQTRNLTWQVFKDNRYDQYCGCPIGRGNKPDLASCGYSVRKQAQRASRIEMEHVVPAENLGRQFACWREGGRDHCNRTDQGFRNAHNDMHNIIPVIGEVNGDRSNYRFDEIQGGYGQYGQCQFKVDSSTRRAEPPPELKGDIARIHFYMRDQHGLRISDQQERLFSVWSRQDPVSVWEKTRDDRIYALQGNRNPYVSGGVELSASKADTPSDVISQRLSAPVISASGTGQIGFDCEHKTCGMMKSCDEALHKLKVCGHSRLDGNNNGIPCQSLCGSR